MCKDMNFEELQKKIFEDYAKQLDKFLENEFEPYFREIGIKGKITRNKLKWWGCKIHVKVYVERNIYTLVQRGKSIKSIEVTFQSSYSTHLNLLQSLNKP